ncbi:uncharacterized protein Z519_02876 [Cladophialophora bantiana CBS 173.52]|uniref:Uncharacterized protein n=1 Tax=Cladophialophora bantiana (strain ATCC 10958 / CBS 173.52 / CDC B-1940 / NIH 8579) TaxID=1442370 RepID=A0A0D2GB52_CLAB1|nr:uncharacterized protein Z519_02876 [Cladophialophora bantiana CBS 173.52]KIW95812.1 hypothetical protein Z519_02876 [Cladophialophora bantiana CBS 173.52]
MNSGLLTSASAGHAKHPKSPWIQVTDIPFSLASATVLASVRENDDPAVELSQLPTISPKSIRIFDICTNAGGARPVGLLLQQHLRRWFKKIKFMPLVHSPKLQSHLFDRHRSSAFEPSFLNALWDESRAGLDVGIALQLPCTQMAKQYKPLNLGHSFTYLVFGLSQADELVVVYRHPTFFSGPMRAADGLGSLFSSSQWSQRVPSRGFSRQQLVKLIILEHIRLHVRKLREICSATYPSTKMNLLYLGSDTMASTITRLRHSFEFCCHVKEFSEMAEFMVQNFEADIGNASRPSLRCYLVSIRHECSQLENLANANHERYKMAWDMYKDKLNVNESRDVKGLTVLAAIFLPLSLSSSILAMSTRLVDLNILLYDFVGVFLILSSIAIVLYISIRGIGALVRKGRYRVTHRLVKMSEHMDGFTNTITNIYSSMMWKSFVVLMLVIVTLAWLTVTVSFIVGMVGDHGTGVVMLKYTAFTTAGIIGMTVVLIVAAVFMFKGIGKDPSLGKATLGSAMSLIAGSRPGSDGMIRPQGYDMEDLSILT